VKIRIFSEATAELEEGLNWYAVRSPDAERKFALAIDRALTQIATEPSRFAEVAASHRACRVEKFPYQIVYRVDGNVVTIVAVAHAKRRPGYWRRRRG
jgi:plasmid stabilization system protein ParE